MLNRPHNSKCNRTGKRSYSSLKAAEAKLKEIRVQGGTKAGRFERRAYYCSYCHNWHLTSSASRQGPNTPIARKPPSMVHSDTPEERKRMEDLWVKMLKW